VSVTADMSFKAGSSASKPKNMSISVPATEVSWKNENGSSATVSASTPEKPLDSIDSQAYVLQTMTIWMVRFGQLYNSFLVHIKQESRAGEINSSRERERDRDDKALRKRKL
jgi:hypothetical protein